MSDLIVRVYDVRFGDAVLVTIPDTENGHAGRPDTSCSTSATPSGPRAARTTSSSR